MAKRAGAKQNSSTNVVDTARKLGIKLRSTSGKAKIWLLVDWITVSF